jgi:hypothetical protein
MWQRLGSDRHRHFVGVGELLYAHRYPISPRILTLRAIFNKLRPEPIREPLPPPKHYEPPRATTARRRRAGR